MSFIQEQLPPIMKKVILKMEDRGGNITHKEFKDFLIKLRITSKDILFYKRYLQSLGYISIKKNKIELKQDNDIDNIIILQCPECGYQWDYKGKAKRAECPRCKHNEKKDVWIKTNITSPISSPTSSI